MLKRFDHVTIVVQDMESAKKFFSILGFEEALSVVISGERFSNYMGVDGIEAEHVTLALANAVPRTEVQLLKYRNPEPIPDPDITNLSRIGFNHVCFAVDDMNAALDKLGVHGIKPLNEVLDFHDRKLVFIPGPEGVTLELSEWY
ncbi:MAG TPA: VOC family protein [Desulfomonilaceae bacterium]|nr:VOC family protein [Desulfomonilaceae bacterium]